MINIQELWCRSPGPGFPDHAKVLRLVHVQDDAVKVKTLSLHLRYPDGTETFVDLQYALKKDLLFS